MYTHAIKLVGNTATLPKWDGRIPSFDEFTMKPSKPTNSVTNSSPRPPHEISSRAQLRAAARDGQRSVSETLELSCHAGCLVRSVLRRSVQSRGQR